MLTRRKIAGIALIGGASLALVGCAQPPQIAYPASPPFFTPAEMNYRRQSIPPPWQPSMPTSVPPSYLEAAAQRPADRSDGSIEHDLMVGAAGFIMGQSLKKPATVAVTGAGETALGTGRMMGWEMLAADGATAASAGKTAAK